MTWRPTQAHLRAIVLAGVLVLVAVIFRRPEAVVLAAPFGVFALWAAARKPAGQPRVSLTPGSPSLLEGQATSLRIAVTDLDPRVDLLTAVVPRNRWFELDPVAGGRVVPAGPAEVRIELATRSLRWGRRTIEPASVVAGSMLGGYRTEPIRSAELTLTTMPLPESFAALDAVPRPAGLVGLHPSRRPGEGTEIAGVRAYRTGDRLRRINWSVSARTGTLHVTSTWTDRDTEVVLMLDTDEDIGLSSGVDGTASSLDIAVRAAAAIAEHYLRNGDRVRLADTASIIRAVRSGSGRAHLRRILDALVDADPRAPSSGGPPRVRRAIPVRAGSLVIVLSPLLRPDVLGRIVTQVHSGSTVICVDTLPSDVGQRTRTADVSAAEALAGALAWRLRLLERAGDLDRLSLLGVPTVAWRGPGTLDEVLRDVSRLSAAPRLR